MREYAVDIQLQVGKYQHIGVCIVVRARNKWEALQDVVSNRAESLPWIDVETGDAGDVDFPGHSSIRSMEISVEPY